MRSIGSPRGRLARGRVVRRPPGPRRRGATGFFHTRW